MDNAIDTFTTSVADWPLEFSQLRLWCHCNPVDAIADAGTIASWQAYEEACGNALVVVESDVEELSLPAGAFRRIATPRENTVSGPDGADVMHCEAVDGRVLIAALLSFAAESYAGRPLPNPLPEVERGSEE